MMRWLSLLYSPLSLGLTVLVASLILGLFHVATRALLPDVAPISQNILTEGLPKALPQQPSMAKFADLSLHPLFTQGRQPPGASVAVSDIGKTVPIVTTGSDWELTGVTGAGKRRFALLWHAKQRRYATVGQGEQLDDWLVGSIDAQSLVLIKEQQQVRLDLKPELLNASTQ